MTNRYTLRLANGEKVVFEAEPFRVTHDEWGIRVNTEPGNSRSWPAVQVVEETIERVVWQAVS